MDSNKSKRLLSGRKKIALWLANLIQISLMATSGARAAKSNMISNFFLAISDLRVISFIYAPTYEDFQEQQHKLGFFVYSGRPELFTNYIGALQYILAILLTMQVTNVIVYVIVLGFPNYYQLQTWISQSSTRRIIFSIFKYIGLMFQYCLSLNLFEYSLITLNTSSIALNLISAYSLAIITLYKIFVEVFIKQSLFLVDNSFHEIINTSPFQIIIILCQLGQTLVYVYVGDSYDAVILHCIFAALVSIIKISEILYFKIKSDQVNIFITLLINSLALVIAVQEFINHYFQVDLIEIFLYITPIIFYCIFNHFISSSSLRLIQLYSIKTNNIQDLRFYAAKSLQLRNSGMSEQVTLMILQSIKGTIKTNVDIYTLLTRKLIINFQKLQKIKNQDISEQAYYGEIQLLIQSNRYLDAHELISKLLSVSSHNKKLTGPQIFHLSYKFINYLQVLSGVVTKGLRDNVNKKYQSNKEFSNISTQIQSLMHLESTRISIQEEILQAVQSKIQNLNLLISNGNRNSKIFKNSFETIGILSKTLNLLRKRYQEFNTLENQKYLIFFKAEIISDYIAAYTVSQTNTQNDNFVNFTNQNLIHSLNQTSYYCLNVSIVSSENLLIVHATSNLIKLTKKKLINSQIHDLLPNYIIPHHQQQMKDFFTQGTNKFYQKKSETSIRIRDNLVENIDLIMDLNSSQTDSLTILLLFSQTIFDKSYFNLDQNYLITETSLNLFETLYQTSLENALILYQIPIMHLIQDFQLIGLSQPTKTQLVVPTISSSKEYLNKQEILDRFTNKSVNIRFTCEIELVKKLINQQDYYYVLYVRNLKKQRSNDFTQDTLHNLNENIKIDQPYEAEFPTDLNQVNIITNRKDSHTKFIVNNTTQGNLYTTNQLIESSNALIGEQQNQEHNVNFDALEIQSQMSSIGMLKVSKFYKHFQLINFLTHSVKPSKEFQKMNALYVLYAIIVIINVILIILTSNKLNNFMSDIQVLSIKNQVYEPIENFIVTRYTIIAYNSQQTRGVINQTQNTQLNVFPRSNLALGYDQAKNNIITALDAPAFQPFLQGRYFTVQLYLTTNIGYPISLTFRSVMELFLNYQYDYKLAYTVYPLRTDSPYSYFSYKNYLLVYNTFTDLNNFILDQTQARSLNSQSSLTASQLPFQLIEGCFYFLLFALYYRYTHLYNGMYRQFININKQQILSEIKRLEKLQQNLKQIHYFQNYAIDIQQKEEELNQNEAHFKQSNNKQEEQQHKYIQNYVNIIVTFIKITFPIVLIIISNIFLYTYYKNYSNTATFYKSISDLGTDIPTIYGQREVSYSMSSFPFLTDSEVSLIRNQILVCVNRTEQFSDKLANFDPSHHLFDSNATAFLESIKTQNLCGYLNPSFTQKSKAFCNSTFNGAITKGLQTVLTYIVNSIRTEQSINNFVSRAVLPTYELEGATLTSDSIQTLLNQTSINLKSYTVNLQSNINIISIVIIIVQVILTVLILFIYSRWEQRRFLELKKMVYLFPQSTLLYDHSFNRNLKLFLTQYDIN